MPDGIVAGWPDSNNGVIVADGAAVKVIVNSSHLVINDGIAGERRERKFSRVDGLNRLLILTPNGYITLDAIRWLADGNIPWCQLGQSSGVQAASGSGYQDSRLLRAQAYAASTDAGLEITRYLLAQKLLGHARVMHGWNDGKLAAYFESRAEMMYEKPTIAACESQEGISAQRYWQAWRDRPVALIFTKTDAAKVPAHWLRYIDRANLREKKTAHNNNATDPVNAMLNYCYQIGYSEAVHACYRAGISPVLGIFHADVIGRASFATDLMEAIRPECDRQVLEIVAGKVERKWFYEMPTGEVRLLPPVTHRLAAGSIQIANALVPHVTEITRLLARYAEQKRNNSGNRSSRLRKGVTVEMIVPDICWQEIRPLLPDRVAGRTSALSDREIVSCMALRMIGVPWSQTLAGRYNHKTILDNMRRYQRAGTYETIAKILRENGHLDSLVMS